MASGLLSLCDPVSERHRDVRKAVRASNSELNPDRSESIACGPLWTRAGRRSTVGRPVQILDLSPRRPHQRFTISPGLSTSQGNELTRRYVVEQRKVSYEP